MIRNVSLCAVLIAILVIGCAGNRETPPVNDTGLPFAIEAKKPFRETEELRLELMRMRNAMAL